MQSRRKCRSARRKFTLAEARRVKRILDPKNKYDLHEFHVGMNVELEHHDVTCGDPLSTGLIVMAHMPETKHYYPKLIRHVEGKPWPKTRGWAGLFR